MIPGAAKTAPQHGWAQGFIPVLRDESGRIVSYAPHTYPNEESAKQMAKFLRIPERRKQQKP